MNYSVHVAAIDLSNALTARGTIVYGTSYRIER